MRKWFVILLIVAAVFIFITGCSDSGSTSSASDPVDPDAPESPVDPDDPIDPETSPDYSSVNIGILKFVPAGTFRGDPASGAIYTISEPFRMSRHEITRTQFASLMKADPVIMKSKAGQSSGYDDPVFDVSWYHAIAFCNILSLKENLTPVYSVIKGGVPIEWSTMRFGDVPTSNDPDWNNVVASWTHNGYRLPTEAEWMWAAMGAPEAGRGMEPDTTGYEKAYTGSTEGNGTVHIGEYAWYKSNAYSKTHPAGTKKPNELGLYDMTGNVYELCWDWWSDTPATNPEQDYRGPASGTYRVAKGGSRGDDANDISLAASSNPEPQFTNEFIGFRVIRR